MVRVALVSLVLGVLLFSARAHAELAILSQFDAGTGTSVGLGFSHTTGNVWVYGDFDATIRSYSGTGSFLTSIPRPGGSANDADVEFAPEELTMGSTTVPAGTLLFIDGESGPAEIYAVDKVTGSVLATLNTSFGASHVVGGTYHPGRNTFFLVQDQLPGVAEENRIAEIDPLTGAVLNNIQVTGIFSVNYGDIEVNAATGNLLVVSSDENRIAEFTPAISLVQYLALPAGVTSLSGIGVDDALGQLWVTSTASTVWRLGDELLPGDYNSNGIVDAADYTVWRDAMTAGSTSLLNDPTPGTVDESDFVYWRSHFGETPDSGSGATANAAIPEPATLVHLLVGTLAMCARRRAVAP